MDTSVAIVGGGPVGLLLALFLDRHGVSSVVFDSEPGPHPHPRGSTHNARTMEHYRTLGLADRVRRLGLPWDHPTGIGFATRYTGFVLADLPHPSQREQAEASPADQVPEPLHRANQVYVERLLAERAASRPRVRIRYGSTVTSVSQDESGVTARWVSDAGEGVLRAAYAVGCDGGRSTVRRGLGIRYRGPGSIDQDVLGRTAVAAHLRLPGFTADVLRERRAWSNWVFNDELALNLIALDGADEFFLLTSSVDPAGAGGGALADLVRRAVGRPWPVEVVGSRAWTPGAALVAERFGVGRVLLAGDAAHLFTPNGGFGMNTGADDVVNLAWKLAAAVRGWAGPGLVASYELERRPVAVRNTAAARRLNEGLGAIPRPAALEADSPVGAAVRAEVGALLAAYGRGTVDTLGGQLGARYDGSPVVLAEPDDVPPPDRFDVYEPSGVPGGRAPHAWLDGGSLHDRFGVGFTLLRMGGATDRGLFTAAARRHGIPLTALDVPQDVVRDLYGRDLALVRPDRHVAWRGDRVPQDPAAVLRAAVGA